jgi:hypothetical protein
MSLRMMTFGTALHQLFIIDSQHHYFMMPADQVRVSAAGPLTGGLQLWLDQSKIGFIESKFDEIPA